LRFKEEAYCSPLSCEYLNHLKRFYDYEYVMLGSLGSWKYNSEICHPLKLLDWFKELLALFVDVTVF